ncbi:hypothetical protein [Candidatus Nitrosopumilus sediminis]|uniref:hypothetical protein n=1 Tax=Candidatus Nitrosopumilus sediminis TaxID=1229909 RepID=UPI0012E9C8ED|nr:hypothetical protein [Candidatus Nitrosopumilus sediminis]
MNKFVIYKNMTTQSFQTKTNSTWDKMVHAPFKKVVKFDLICMGLGVMIGMGLGAFLVTEVF